MPVCRICGQAVPRLFETRVLGRYLAEFAYCVDCDHVFAAEPNWLAEAYADALDASDTDVVVRNMTTALRLAGVYRFLLPGQGRSRYLDMAAGSGLMVRSLRDLGFDCYWSDMYAQNQFARGFEHSADDGPCEAVSAIEVLEHCVDPAAFVVQALAQSGADSIVFSTQTFATGRPPGPKEWGYYALDGGQHIAFFSAVGLARLAERLGLNYYPLGRLHLFTRLTLPAWRVALVRNRWLMLPLAGLAARALGSRRVKDQRLIIARRTALSQDRR